MVFADSNQRKSIIRFNPTFRASWPHIDRENQYDYAASGMIENNEWKVWYCGEDSNEERLVGDSIVYWTMNSKGETSFNFALRNTLSDIKEDGRHACAPTVFKHSNPYIFSGRELYKMYYECSRRFYDKNTDELIEGFTQICHAISFDGKYWKKYNENIWNSYFEYGNSDSNPTPVIKVNQKILDNCQYEFYREKHKIRRECSISNGVIINYGVGHPSAIVREINGGQQIWLYYFDSKGEWPGKVYLTKSWDGFNFDSPIETNLTHNVDVKFFALPFKNYSGYFIATQGIENDNYFAYSFDGVNWTWYSNVKNKTSLKIGLASSNHKIAYAQPTILGNKFGIVESSFVNILSGEGNGEPWYTFSGLWLIQGLFAPLFENEDFNQDGYVDIFDFQKIISEFNMNTIFNYNNFISIYEKRIDH